ncbi:hypothetical protein CCC_00446 [Paramagnetospirillum magnetotacticum MS-1]|uniref:Hemerythrin-like domain-containing protein n=1 Tax=Paramagnetospirillum magnetotacticum MS-1 TaxID=272627 RepID=A0A0C2YRQ1_PARME|nr:hemerythrin [Paramagnetospirillum magnetotacticum]KIL97385.1 hypothetical protein CCC_00446 [Paramagnetospirillum magnetotacticum MS-1]
MIAIWDNRYTVGNALADAEHRQVISLLNEIDVARSVGAPPEVIGKALETLVRSIESHFAGDQPPQREHAAIIMSARRLLTSWQSRAPGAIERRALINLARRWFDHMGRNERVMTSQRLAG